MARALAILAASALLVSGAAGVAQAVPVPAPPPCTFVLSPPSRAGDTVTATVESVGCGALALPYSAVACLQTGDGGPIQCAQGRGADPAQVAVPYQSGVPFIATGRGCAGWVNLQPEPECQLLGPVNATV